MTQPFRKELGDIGWLVLALSGLSMVSVGVAGGALLLLQVTG